MKSWKNNIKFKNLQKKKKDSNKKNKDQVWKIKK